MNFLMPRSASESPKNLKNPKISDINWAADNSLPVWALLIQNWKEWEPFVFINQSIVIVDNQNVTSYSQADPQI